MICLPVAKLPSWLASINPNIHRDLSPAERAEQTARRKELYEALHPETAHGTNQHASSRQNGESSSRFTRATAQATNLSKRSIQRAAYHGEHLALRVHEPDRRGMGMAWQRQGTKLGLRGG